MDSRRQAQRRSVPPTPEPLQTSAFDAARDAREPADARQDAPHGESNARGHAFGSFAIVPPEPDTQQTPEVETGAALPADVQASMETPFGQDFGEVRVHAGAGAAALARSIRAQAFTQGAHIYFGAGQYAPRDASGARLLAHELAHVVQQSAGGADGASGHAPARMAEATVAPDDSAAEREARAAAELAARGRPVPPGLLRPVRPNLTQRAPDGGTPDGGAPPATTATPPATTATPAAPTAAPRDELDAKYKALVKAGDWAQAAIYLNGFNDPDIAARVGALTHEQRIALYGAAPFWATRITGAVAAVDADAAAPRTQLLAKYNAAVTKGDWVNAAVYLNGFNDPDIDARIAALTPDQRLQLMSGVRQAAAIGTGDRIMTKLRTSTGVKTGEIYGHVTHTETPHSAASAGSGYSFEINIAFTPNPKVVTCDEISFVQTSRVVQPGTNTNKEYMEPQNSRRNANNEAVDRIKTRKQGWYGYNNDGTHASTITPGKSSTTPVIAAKFYDKPSDAMTNVSFNFETAVIAKSGSQANLVYSVIKWGFDVDAAGAVTAHTVTVEDRVSAGFGTAVDAWNKQAAGPAADRNAPDQVALPTFR